MVDRKTSSRPTIAFVLGLLGGLLDLLVSLGITLLGTALGFISRFLYAFGGLGIACSLVVIASSMMMYLHPAKHNLWGGLVVLFSVICLITSLGGLIVGLILGIIGGLLGIAWRPAFIEING